MHKYLNVNIHIKSTKTPTSLDHPQLIFRVFTSNKHMQNSDELYNILKLYSFNIVDIMKFVVDIFVEMVHMIWISQNYSIIRHKYMWYKRSYQENWKCTCILS
jgi:hypothetical protein